MDSVSFEWPEITAETPIEEVKRIHRLIWDYVVEHGRKPETPYHADCAACEYGRCIALNADRACTTCSHCPIKWPDRKSCGYDNLYDKWWCTSDYGVTAYGDAKDLAIAIRDVEFKPESVPKE